jgi:hypothetical protein
MISMVYGVWCMVCGVWCMVYGVWCMVYGVWCMVYGVYGVYGVWCMVYGVWCTVYGVRCVRCVRCVVCGVWCMVYGVWYMVYCTCLLRFMGETPSRSLLFMPLPLFWLLKVPEGRPRKPSIELLISVGSTKSTDMSTGGYRIQRIYDGG